MTAPPLSEQLLPVVEAAVAGAPCRPSPRRRADAATLRRKGLRIAALCVRLLLLVLLAGCCGTAGCLFTALPSSCGPLASLAGFSDTVDGVPVQPLRQRLVSWLQGDGAGLPGMVVLAAAETAALMLCMPGYSTMEFLAGALYGGLWGTVTCAVAKGTAAVLSFALVVLLREHRLGRWAEGRVAGAESDAGSPHGGGWGERLRRGIAKDRFQFCVLLRCSPMPAWMSNYALPLAGVPFGTYLPASLLGMMPPLVSNVYIGAMGASVASAVTGGGRRVLDLPGILAMSLSLLSSTLLVRQLAKVDLDEDPEPAGSA